MSSQKNLNSGTIDEDEIKHFSKDSTDWWNENGAFKPLHRLNPIRMQYIKSTICQHYNLNTDGFTPFSGLNVLDIGCGGGLICEPLSRLGANVTGIDGDQNAIAASKEHSTQQGLDIQYICGDAANIDKKHDVVCALEVAEHVSDLAQFFEVCAALLKPDGVFIMSTLNRTVKSYTLGIIAAEHILRWVPRGTHHWKKFIKPSELARLGRAENLNAQKLKGLIFNPLKNEFELSDDDFDVNYIISFSKPKLQE